MHVDIFTLVVMKKSRSKSLQQLNPLQLNLQTLSSRRDFLKTASLLASAAALSGATSGCVSLRRWMRGESIDGRGKVLILGAGLSGLSAAYELKKNKIPFRVYEGSERFGGRVRTVRSVNVSQQVADLGGERIESDHDAILDLTKELSVPVIERNPAEGSLLYAQKQWWSGKSANQAQQKMQKIFLQLANDAYGNSPQVLNQQNFKHFPKALYLDEMSAEELIKKVSKQLEPWQILFLQKQCLVHWGVGAEKISALHLVHWLRDHFRLGEQKYYKISGGAGTLTEALYDRINGVLPSQGVQFGYKLTEIELENDYYVLSFTSPKGHVEIQAQNVICTLPATMLRQVKGWQNIAMSDNRKQLISEQELGSHSKLVTSYNNRFWKDNLPFVAGANILTDLKTLAIMEAGDPVDLGTDTVHGLLEAYYAGDVGAEAGPHLLQNKMQDLAALGFKNISFENIDILQNWKKNPWSLGSRSYLGPGQFQKIEMELPQSTTWFFAGDTDNPGLAGTMNGAVRSAQRAVRYIEQLMSLS